MFEKFRQLHIQEPGRNWFHSLWRVLQAFHDLPGPTGLSPHRILFLRDRVPRTLPWMNHGKVARDADAMMSEAEATAVKVCKSLHDEHEQRAKYFKEGKIHKYSLKDTVCFGAPSQGRANPPSPTIVVYPRGHRAQDRARRVCRPGGRQQNLGSGPCTTPTTGTGSQRASGDV